MGKKVKVFCPDKISNRLKGLFPTENIQSQPIYDVNTVFVSVDVASMAMLGKFDELFAERGFSLSIDHHFINSVLCERRLRFDNYIANGEIIYELIIELGVDIDEKTANYLYTAICSDSGGFKFSATRPETYETAAHLIRAGADFVNVNRVLFEQKTVTQLAVEKMAYDSLELFYDGRVAIILLKSEDLEKAGVTDNYELDGVAQLPRQIAGVDISASIRPVELNGTNKKYKVSMRSNSDFDVSEFAKKFNGGGHYHAAGFRYEGNGEETKNAVVKALAEYMNY
jgi:phosphoesterase RecJ-like protein